LGLASGLAQVVPVPPADFGILCRFFLHFATYETKGGVHLLTAQSFMPHHNIVRRVRLYKLLRTGRTFAINELAEILGVEERIIHRDLAVLQQGSDHIEIIEASNQRPVCFDTKVLEPRGIRC
jgi:hypothetical protein